MMTNLFSSFDPSTSLLSLNWVSSLLFILFMPSIFFMMNNKLGISMNMINSHFIKETNNTLKNNTMFSFLMNSLFTLVLFNNFLGLFPYIFTSTSHLVITLSLSLTIWVALMFYGVALKTKAMLVHLVPMNTPSLLMPFMVVIESISNFIRPLTLSIRLSANMIAGHLLMTLLGNQLASLNLMTIMIPTELLLMLLEMAVSMIQAYVFSILMTLYIKEVSE